MKPVAVGTKCATCIRSNTKDDTSCWILATVKQVDGKKYVMYEKDDTVNTLHIVKRKNIVPYDQSHKFRVSQEVIALFNDPYINMLTTQYYKATVLDVYNENKVLLRYKGSDTSYTVDHCNIIPIPDGMDPKKFDFKYKKS